jgi:acyl-homoserine lactone acylase PvdQ
MIGAALVGLPFMLTGKTEYIAWGVTILRSDASDLYEEKVKGKFYQFEE